MSERINFKRIEFEYEQKFREEYEKAKRKAIELYGSPLSKIEDDQCKRIARARAKRFIACKYGYTIQQVRSILSAPKVDLDDLAV